MALLLFQRRHHCQHAFDETGAGRTLRANAPFAPQHPGTDRPLGRIIGRLDGPRSWDRPLYAFRGGLRGAGASSTDAKIAANIERGF